MSDVAEHTEMVAVDGRTMEMRLAAMERHMAEMERALERIERCC